MTGIAGFSSAQNRIVFSLSAQITSSQLDGVFLQTERGQTLVSPGGGGGGGGLPWFRLHWTCISLCFIPRFPVQYVIHQMSGELLSRAHFVALSQTQFGSCIPPMEGGGGGDAVHNIAFNRFQTWMDTCCNITRSMSLFQFATRRSH